MAIFTEAIEQKQFDSKDEVIQWAEEQNENILRVPVSVFLDKHSSFYDDEYFGDGEYLLRFNQKAFQVFCSIIGVRSDLLGIIESHNLSSFFLNDLLAQKVIRDKFSSFDFIIDTNQRVILGLVSGTYVGYSNNQFLEDIFNLPLIDSFIFRCAYAVNTELSLILYSEKYHGTIKGKGGIADDKTEIGLAFKNSMVGTSSVNIDYHLYRLICANGMIVPASESVNRIYHSGNIDSFIKRLGRSFTEVSRKLALIKELIFTLDGISFHPEKLALDTHLSEKIFEIIPGSKQLLCEYCNKYLVYPKGASEAHKRELKIDHDTILIRAMPYYYSGKFSGSVFNSSYRDNPTMFDFVNVFTEHAKELSINSKLEVEEKTGALANYIHRNARKFM